MVQKAQVVIEAWRRESMRGAEAPEKSVPLVL
jgi:hypothetical protein